MDSGVPFEVVAALRMAPYDAAYWAEALDGAAACCGASSAQIIAYSRDRIPMLLAPGFSEDDIARYIALGGADPSVNVGMAFMTGPSPIPLRPYSDDEYMTEEERRRDPLYNEFFGAYDGPSISAGVLIRRPELQANLSFMRPDRMDQHDRDATAMLLPLFARACELQFALEGRSAAVMAQALDTLGDAILLCDASGHLLGATRAGEAVLRAGRHLGLRRDRVICPDARAAPTFERLLDGCANIRSQLGMGGAFVARADDGVPARIDVAPLPGERGDASLRPLTMIRVREAAPAGRLDITLAMTAFGLTRAEAEVAEAMVQGSPSRTIAARRNVSHVTVNSQARTVMLKTGCRRRSELPTLLAPFMTATHSL